MKRWSCATKWNSETALKIAVKFPHFPLTPQPSITHRKICKQARCCLFPCSVRRGNSVEAAGEHPGLCKPESPGPANSEAQRPSIYCPNAEFTSTQRKSCLSTVFLSSWSPHVACMPLASPHIWQHLADWHYHLAGSQICFSAVGWVQVSDQRSRPSFGLPVA